ncbi:hypothetical protein KXX40_001939 [Aspergillus fumigatus]|nr:hypothetical protein KXX40_001939 [Aspergillus fumigatus]
MAPPPVAINERAIVDNPQKLSKRKWLSYIWDTLDKSPEERKLLFKLDTAILTFASLGSTSTVNLVAKLTVMQGYFIKYLDQVNINNAFVSGMKEDLNLYGNQLNYMQTCWTVGYVIGEIPSNLLLTRIRPRYWIPAMELLWTILTFAMARCNTPTQFYVLRFFIGLAESTFYPGMQYIIGSWYRKDELAKRSCIFHTSGGIASMFSGYLMAGVYHLGGRGGFKGWQWLFIIDGVISLPVALSGFFILPDVPEISNPWYLTKEDIALSQKRMQLEGRKNREPLTSKKLKKIFSSWHIYLLTLLYICFNNGAAGSQPIFQHLTIQIINIISYTSLAIWDINTGWKWTCYIIAGAGYGLSGLLMAWAHEICAEDNEERALVVGSMNEMAYVFQAWLPQIVWRQVEAPEYRKGFITVTVLSGILILATFVTVGLEKRERAQKLSGATEGDSEDSLAGVDSEGDAGKV